MNEPLPKLHAAYDDELGPCIEMEYTFDDYCDLNDPAVFARFPYATRDATVAHRVETRVRISVNSVILLALNAYRHMDVPRHERKVTIAAHVHKVTSHMIDG